LRLCIFDGVSFLQVSQCSNNMDSLELLHHSESVERGINNFNSLLPQGNNTWPSFEYININIYE
jgi:hypothetical protein